MRGLVALANKEWRDLRAMTWASMLVVLAACLVIRWTIGALAHKDGDTPGQWFLEPFVPASILLYAAMAAADLVGGETASGRIDQSALLPARPFQVWASKAATLLTAVTLFAAWTVLVQIATLWAVDGEDHVGRFLVRARSAAWMAPLVVTFASVTLLVSTFRLRGLGAVIGGGGLAAGLWTAGVWFADLVGLDNAMKTSFRTFDAELCLAATGLAAVALLASALAYTFGRIHLGRVVRPLAIGLGTLVALVVAPASAYAWAAFRVVPGADGVSLEQAWPSPDGRFVAATFVNLRSPAQPRRTFVIETVTGRVVEPDCSGWIDVRLPAFDGVWDADGTLQLVDFTRGAEVVDAWVDPGTGAVLRERSRSHRAWVAEDQERSRLWRDRSSWYVAKNAKIADGGPTYAGRVLNHRTKAEVTQRSWTPVAIWFAPGDAAPHALYTPRPDVLATRALPDGTERVLLSSAAPWTREDLGDVDLGGRHLLVRHDGRWKSLDLAAGVTTDVPSVERPSWWPVLGGPPRRLVITRERRNPAAVEIVDLDSGARLRWRADASIGAACGTADGRVLVRTNDGLDLHDRDLELVKRVWPPEAARGNR